MHKYFYTRAFRYYSLPRKIDFLKRKYMLMFLFVVVYLFLAISILVSFSIYKNLTEEIHFPRKNPELIINLTELTPKETQVAEKVINDLKEEYLSIQKSITIGHNIKKSYPYPDKWNNLTAGFNADRNIFIEFTSNEKLLREYLCHELLHSFVIHTDEGHEIVYDLGEKMVCFQ